MDHQIIPENTVIEKNVPIPLVSTYNGFRAMLDKMEIGDSFILPYDTEKRYASIRNYAYKIASQCKVRVIVRREGENTMRFWLAERTSTK